MLDETRGMTPEAVSTTSFRMSATIVRRHRRAAGLDPETGKAFEEEQLDAEKRRRRVQELAAQGYSDTYIARKVGVHRSTVERDLGKRAA
jgi:DNA-binding NarL/FixJ family response regulator